MGLKESVQNYTKNISLRKTDRGSVSLINVIKIKVGCLYCICLYKQVFNLFWLKIIPCEDFYKKAEKGFLWQ